MTQRHDDLRVVDRDIGGPLVEVIDRIAPVTHHLGHQRVGLPGGRCRIVHEPALGGPPCLEVAVPNGGLEDDDVELPAPLLAGRQISFRGALVPAPGNGALVLGTKLLLQSLGTASLPQEHRNQHHNDHDDKDRDQ